MERAATRLTGWFIRHFDPSRRVVVIAGPGNNGGDALAMARMLIQRQYNVLCYILEFGTHSDDFSINLQRLEEQELSRIKRVGSVADLDDLEDNDVIVDGIFGSGLSRKVTGLPAEIIRIVNKSGSSVVAIDIPSGLFGEDNRDNAYESIISADYTLTFQFPFLSFFFRENAEKVGIWRVLDIGLHPAKIKTTEADYQTVRTDDIKAGLHVRHKFSHKGTYGNALLICGCYGMMGAGLLAAESCLRGGTGLVTLHIPRMGYNIAQTALPEAIVSLDQSDIIFTGHPDLSPYQAVGIGPGIGCKENTGRGLKRLLEEVKVPLVIDADGINLLAKHKEWLDDIPADTILTPHPKEFDRLAGPSESSYDRHLKQREFSEKYRVYIILKGAYTGISTPDGKYYFNTTGNPGMATGGSGDVLTGLLTGMLAQGYAVPEAAIFSVYLHGLAGDLAAAGSSEESLIARDIISHIGQAFRKIKEKSLLDISRVRQVIN